MITSEDAQILSELLKKAVVEGLLVIKAKSGTDITTGQTPYLPKKYQYPILEKFASGHPRFSFFPYETVDYAELYKKSPEKLNLVHAKNYRDFVLDSDSLQYYFSYGNHQDDQFKDFPQFGETIKDIASFGFIADFCDCYIYSYGFDFEDDHFDYLCRLYMAGISSKNLQIKICIPIIYAHFQSDVIALGDNVFIERMSKEFQLARNEQMSLTGTVNGTVIGAATHAFVFKGWSVPNLNQSERNKVLYEMSAYKEARALADLAFAALRIAIPNLETGYGQIIALEDGWRTSFKSNLPELVVLSERNYPQHFENFGWLNESLTVTSESNSEITSSFTHLMNAPQLKLAVSRLNKASLYNRDDDSIIDIAIALESLLTNDSKSEINYRLSARAALLCKTVPFRKYSAKEIAALCKKIYDFRSSIVHGEFAKQQKKRLVEVDEDKSIAINELALEFLKHIILALSLHPKIKQAADIDNLLFE